MPTREGKKWRGVVTQHGKKVAQQIFDRKSDAKKWEEETKKSLLRSQSTGLTLAEAVAAYLDHSEQQFAPDTYKLKKVIFDRFLKSIDLLIPVKDVEPAAVQAYLLFQAQTRSAYGANVDRKNLIAFWNWLSTLHEDITKNPAKRVVAYRHEPHQLYTPPESDVAAVLDVADKQERAWLLVYLLTGAREQEVNRLKWADVSFQTNRICLWSRKTKSHALEPQWIDAAPLLLSTLIDLPRSSEYVFYNTSKKKPYTDRGRLILSLCRRAGVRPFAFHSLRRFVGSVLAKEGRPIQEIQHLLRHKALAHTERYIRGLGVDLTVTVQALEDLIVGKNARKNAPPLRRVK